MINLKSVLKEQKELQEVDFGSVRLTLKEFLKQHRYTRYQLSRHTSIKYQTIDRYYKNNIDRVDLTLLAKMCFSLECDLSDILQYIPPKTN